jgi:hypothetical protein
MCGLGMLNYLQFGLQTVVLHVTPILQTFFYNQIGTQQFIVITVDNSYAS